MTPFPTVPSGDERVRHRVSRRPVVLFVIVYVGAICFATLLPVATTISHDELCVFCGALGGMDFLLNVVLFTPLGWGLWMLWRRPSTIVAAGILLTLTIEVLQWRIVPGRDASLGDLMANTIGTGFGVFLAVQAPAWVRASGRKAFHLAMLFAVAAIGVVAGTSSALQPYAIGYPLFVQWTPRRDGMDDFPTERLREATLNGRPLSPAVMARHQPLRSAIDATEVRARIVAPVPASRRPSIIVRTAYSQVEGFLMGQRGDAAVFRATQRASRLKLRPLLLRLDRAFDAVASGELTLVGRNLGREIVLAREADGGRVQTTLRRSPGLGWTLFLPFELPINDRWWPVNAIWLALLTLPAAFLAGRARVGKSPVGAAVSWIPAVAAPVSLVVVAVAMGLSLPTPFEWIGIVGGIAAGGAVAYLTRGSTARLDANGPHRQL